MTSSARMIRVQIGDNPDDSVLMSQAEIDQMRRSQALHAEQDARAAAEDAAELPDFARSDAEILASQAAAKPSAAATSMPSRNTVIITLGGLAVALAMVVLSWLLSGGQQSAGQALAPVTLAATTATAAPTEVAPTATAEARVGAFFDYSKPASSTEITPSGMLRVDGKAGDQWRLVALSNGRPDVWISTADLPATLPQVDPLRDYAPVATSLPAPAPAYQPDTSGGGTGASSCTEDTAPYVVKTVATDPSHKGGAVANFVRWSCISQADAQAKADAAVAVYLASYTPPPTNTPVPATPTPASGG